MTKYEKGKEILPAKYDKLTIYTNSTLKNGSSAAYDGFGVSAKKLCLIENNIFKNNFSSKQYADYLGIDATGPFGPIEIEGGDNTIEQLYDESEEIIEVISFSSFVPDLSSGDFSAEIRLAYKIKDGIRTPVKGGLFNGNIFTILKEMQISKERIEEVGYVGPKAIKFYKGDIVGL
jgi:predicted Zn-dependent protease